MAKKTDKKNQKAETRRTVFKNARKVEDKEPVVTETPEHPKVGESEVVAPAPDKEPEATGKVTGEVTGDGTGISAPPIEPIEPEVAEPIKKDIDLGVATDSSPLDALESDKKPEPESLPDASSEDVPDVKDTKEKIDEESDSDIPGRGSEKVSKAGKGFIRHRNVAGERRKIRATLESFFARIRSRIEGQIAEGIMDGWERNSEDALSNMKELLQSLTDDNAMEEKDNELNVAIAAMFVDFHKQSEDKQKQLLGVIW